MRGYLPCPVGSRGKKVVVEQKKFASPPCRSGALYLRHLQYKGNGLAGSRIVPLYSQRSVPGDLNL